MISTIIKIILISFIFVALLTIPENTIKNTNKELKFKNEYINLKKWLNDEGNNLYKSKYKYN